MPEQRRLDQRHGVVCTTDPFHTVIPAYFTVYCVVCVVYGMMYDDMLELSCQFAYT